MKRFTRAAALAASALMACYAPARAQGAYPERQIEMIVPFSPGSGADVLARILAPAIQDELKVPVLVENREGAAGLIGLTDASRAPKDGYTIVLAADPPFSLAPLFQSATTYDPPNSFAPIARVGATPMVLVASAQSGIKSIAELRARVRAKPADSFYASNGNGSPAQVSMELFKAASGIPIPEVTYKSTAQMTTDVGAGHVLTAFMSVSLSGPLIQSGKLRPIAVGSKSRLEKFPDVPTLAEALQKPDYRAGIAYEFLAPAGTPPDRVQRLYAAVEKALGQAKVRSSMEKLSVVPDLQSPAELAKIVQQDATNGRQIFDALQKK